jgi:dihydrolipoamide dehydrogenase
MTDKSMYDIAVLGAGPGGYVAALRAAQRGARVCLVEAGPVGGTCLNVGCIPTKAMLHASELAWHMRTAAEFGLVSAAPVVDGAAFFGRVNKVIASLNRGVEYLLKTRKVDLVRGRGRLTAADTIEVLEAPCIARGSLTADPPAMPGALNSVPRTVRARSIIIATGSRPARPPFLPWDSGCVMTTDEAIRAAALPKSLIILGGGVIGCEFATMYAELGIPTTVVEMLPSLVANLDADIVKAVTASLKKRGVNIIVGASITSASAIEGDSGARNIRAELAGGQVLEASYLLAAVGRAPNTADIGLEQLGVTMDGKVIRVDDHCRTSVPNIYAIGDVAETRQYAHLASRMGLVAADNAAGKDARDDRTVVPAGMYTHPEVAIVGLSEKQAVAQPPSAVSGNVAGITAEGPDVHRDATKAAVRIVSFPQMALGMARAYGQTEGFVKIIAQADGKVLGGAIVGAHATDTIHLVAAAIRHGQTVADLAELIHAHPTFAEGVGEAAELWLGLPVHVP